MKFTSQSAKETYNFAKNYALSLRGGEVIALFGNLGAGKTVFAQGLARGLTIRDNITSPTFVVMKIYPIHKHPSISTLCHVDAYRLTAPEDINTIGLDEYLHRPDCVCLIEWPEKIRLSKSTKIVIKYVNNYSRLITY
ncbi:MAG: tRNA (adenosine(37)-N6)-threonylcarbamoyltransferase complex ATPase subunit type 1 TsaE [Candidatus Falkowbacteria bacterium]